MKKITLITIVMGVFVIANAQVDKRKILEKLTSELIPQTEDFNPFQYAREEYIVTYLGLSIGTSDYCEKAKEEIEMFYEHDSIVNEKEKCELIHYLSRFECQEVYSFLETQINIAQSEAVRCEAIVDLAWSLDPNYLPCISKYAKKDSLSALEKLAIARAFTIFGIYTSHSELKEDAIKLFDEICYDFSSDTIPGFDTSMDPTRSGCFWSYYMLGGEVALNYYDSMFEQDESRRPSAALLLAELGEYEKALPYFVEIIKSGGIGNQILYAIKGLAAIGTEEAFNLIREQIQSKNEAIAKEAKWIFDYIEMKRREE